MLQTPDAETMKAFLLYIFKNNLKATSEEVKIKIITR
jgi:hypothetical protein